MSGLLWTLCMSEWITFFPAGQWEQLSICPTVSNQRPVRSPFYSYAIQGTKMGGRARYKPKLLANRILISKLFWTIVEYSMLRNRANLYLRQRATTTTTTTTLRFQAYALDLTKWFQEIPHCCLNCAFRIESMAWNNESLCSKLAGETWAHLLSPT